MDRTVRLWTLGGQYISTFGTFKPWKTILSNIPAATYYEDYDIPLDIKKIGSSTTMKVCSNCVKKKNYYTVIIFSSTSLWMIVKFFVQKIYLYKNKMICFISCYNVLKGAIHQTP